MGSGLAKAIYQRYPIVKYKYHEYCKHKSPTDLLGTVLPVRTEDYIFYNLFGQLYYGNSSITKKCYTNYPSIKSMFEKIANKHKGSQVNIAIPYGMCCGLAGGDWDKIMGFIEEYLSELNVTIYRHDS